MGRHGLIALEIHNRARQPGLFLVIWVVAAHILLPRLNRLLPGLYVPDYFTGRTRTADGLLGHPVTLRSSWHFIRASLLRRSYPTAPVSALFVFQRRQTLAFER